MEGRCCEDKQDTTRGDQARVTMSFGSAAEDNSMTEGHWELA